jgi:nicotinamide mononucleotide transporter
MSILDLLMQQTRETTWLEWGAVVFGVAEVLYARADKIWLYPTGIIGTVLTIYILVQSRLYAESVLNVYYIVMSVYGWWHWANRSSRPAVRASYSTRQEWLITAAICLAGTVVAYLVLKKYTPSNVPLWDAWVAATGWAGMWLLARRKIENWVLLNVSNAFAIPLFYYKHLILFAALTLFLFVIAIQGYFAWRKEIRSEMSIS